MKTSMFNEFDQLVTVFPCRKCGTPINSVERIYDEETKTPLYWIKEGKQFCDDLCREAYDKHGDGLNEKDLDVYVRGKYDEDSFLKTYDVITCANTPYCMTSGEEAPQSCLTKHLVIAENKTAAAMLVMSLYRKGKWERVFYLQKPVIYSISEVGDAL